MKSCSASSQTVNAFRAGIEIGEKLFPINPEIVFLFISVHYIEKYKDFYDGLIEGLGQNVPLIAGSVGDGIIERQCYSNQGVAALALNSCGEVQWNASIESNVRQDSFKAARTCAESVVRSGDTPACAFVFADGISSDGTCITNGLNAVLKCPIAGGLSCDDRKFSRTPILYGDTIVDNAILVVAASGNIICSINAASGWVPLGEKAVIEKCDGKKLYRIGGITPYEFFRKQLGKSLGEVDLGSIPLAVFQTEDTSQYTLRTPVKFDPETGEIVYFGSISPGKDAQVCTASKDQILGGVSTSVNGAAASITDPAACFVISCAARKWLLDDSFAMELKLLQDKIGTDTPIAGFPGFGEIAPFKNADGTHTETFFHNTTFVTCLLSRSH